jgi:hypothetical protein
VPRVNIEHNFWFVKGEKKNDFEKTLPELLDWIQQNRYMAALTCEQRNQYRVEPLCTP